MVFPVTLILYIVLWVILFGFYSCNLMQIKRFYKSCNLKKRETISCSYSVVWSRSYCLPLFKVSTTLCSLVLQLVLLNYLTDIFIVSPG